eukprot:TRINITY_DN13689_c0_g1_i1.p1 TRINITY_DN13689_c0_g1~~TRINITY_DN13689_c0_g1_i1.p1  ORF type:complete len:122 (-),score=15.87 TRINITY_DN13689_c0_g1_i1:205-570(-)
MTDMARRDEQSPNIPTRIVVSHLKTKKRVEVEFSSVHSPQEVHDAILNAFQLRKAARIVLRRQKDDVVVVPGPTLEPGSYTLQVVDDGRGPLKQHVAVALIGAPLLILWYRIVLGKIFSED